MSKENHVCRAEHRGFVRFLGLVVVGAGLCVPLSGCRSIPLSRNPDVKIQSKRDLAQAVSLRGLPYTREVAVERETSEALHASLAQELEKEENRAFLSDTELLLKQFRVLKAEDDLKALYLRVMSEQVAAYYDPEKKRLAYVEGCGGVATNIAALPGMERFVYVHEFCHALEDGRFDLERLSKDSLGSFDRSLALTSLVEGDAVLVGLDSVFAELPMNSATPFGGGIVNMFSYMAMDDSQEQMKGCPAFLGGTLLRPYLDGAVFANRIRREAGWQSVDTIYRSRLPLTTAEILYPEKRYLKKFSAAQFAPADLLFASARRGITTNSLGALGTALWLGGEKFVTASQYSFLEGWMGDRVYLIRGDGGSVTTVWLTYLERPDQARAFTRKVKSRLRDSFGGASWNVAREGRLVAAVWGVTPEACAALAAGAAQARVVADTPSALGSCCSDFPWPVRFSSYEGYSVGCDVLGGYALDIQDGKGFYHYSLASGLLLRAEANPDRHYWGTLFGLVSHVEDARSDFTYWRLPVLASWFRRGRGDELRYRWSVLWGLLAYGGEQDARVLLVPVWKHRPAPATPAP